MRSKAKPFAREVRRARRIQARLLRPGCADRPCTIIDLSARGAKIVVQGDEAITSRFELAFADNGPRRLCELAWQRGKTAGVRFVG
jgi:PilZ domain-containing protein